MQVVQEIGVGQMDTDQQLIVQTEQESSIGASKSGGGGSPLPLKGGKDVGKSSLASSRLGIQQNELKKGVGDRTSKLGRKKDMEKIKLTGETLVDSGLVMTLDSHFSCPQK